MKVTLLPPIIYCCNDGAVMNAWGEQQGIGGSNVTFMGDPSCVLTDALKLRMQHPGPVGAIGPLRCQRHALFVEKGIIKALEVAASGDDPAGDDKPDVTLVENMLSLIPGGSAVVESAPKPSVEDMTKRISQEIEANPVVVFSKSTCPFCKKAKQAFADIGVVPTVFELDKEEIGPTGVAQDLLNELTGARSVPRVFIGGYFIGGGDDTVAKAATGELKKLADAAMADVADGEPKETDVFDDWLEGLKADAPTEGLDAFRERLKAPA